MDEEGKKSRNVAWVALAIALAAAVIIGITQLPETEEDDGSPATAQEFEQALADAPPKLASLYGQGDALLPGGLSALDDELSRLRGTPAVVNAWASWCGPCRAEFPLIQDAVVEYGNDVAFLGIDANDNEDAARTFLDERPLPYPSYTDPDFDVKREWRLVGLPAMAFYDANGKRVFIHRGPYTTYDELAADIERYAN